MIVLPQPTAEIFRQQDRQSRPELLAAARAAAQARADFFCICERLHTVKSPPGAIFAACIVIAMPLGRTTTMRTAVLTLLGSLALSAAAMPANAAPTIAQPGAPTVSNVVQVSGGCGPYYYRDVYGYCQPYNYGYSAEYRYPAWYPYRHWYRWHHWH